MTGKFSLRRSFSVGIVAILLLMSMPAITADNGAITLRLEPTESQSSEPENPAGEIMVQPSLSRPMPKPVVAAASAVLMDAQTGQILYAKNPHMRLPMASTTKIMTAILLIEHCKMVSRIKASKNAADTPYTSLHLKPGETITVKDLLTGMLVRSANDAAVAAAEHIAGSTAKFAKMMNKKAAEIGCKDTHFVTPNGLYDPNHYSSAYDLCLIARYAFRYPEFNQAINTRKYFLSSRSINKADLAVFNLSKFLKHYPGADGVKSGYIKQARHCYVGSATRDNWRLVSAVLRSENTTNDTTAMMNYGFGNFQPITIVRAHEKCFDAKITGGSARTVGVVVKKDLRIAVPRTGAKITRQFDLQEATAPVMKGHKLGKVVAIVNGKEIASADLHAADEIGISMARKVWSITKWGGILVAGLIGGKYGTTIAKNSRRRRRKFTAPLRDNNRYR